MKWHDVRIASMSRLVCCVLLASLTAVTASWAQTDGSGNGDGGVPTVEAQLAEILSRHQLGADEAKDYEIPEAEANRFLRDQQLAELPPGVESPWVRFDEKLAVVGATVDLDQVKDSLPPGGLLQLLTGKVPVELTTNVTAEAGIGKLTIEKVLVAGVELPVSVVEAMVDDGGSIPFLPGFRLGEAFALPFGMESIRCQVGRLTLRQRPTPRP